MTRVSPRLLFLLGALLLALWFASPLLSSPPTGPAAPTIAAAPVPLPELDDMNREVERLEARLDEPVRPTAPYRDPFRFTEGAGDLAYLRPPEAPADSAGPTATTASPIAWPSLVAIVSSGTGASLAPRAVFEDAAALVHILGVGDVYGDITVSAITGTEVTLVHTPSARSRTVTLR